MPRDSFEKFCREIVKRYRKSPHYNSLTEKNHSFARGLRRLFHNLEAKNFDLRSTFGLPPGIGSVRPAGRFLSTDFPDFHHAAIGGKPEEYSGLRSISHSEYDQFLEQQIEAYVDADFDYLHRGVGHAVIGTLLSGSYECPAEPSSESTSQACPAVLAGLEKPDSWEQVTILPFTGHNDAVRISVGNAKPIPERHAIFVH